MWDIVYGIGLPVFYSGSAMLLNQHWAVRFFLLALIASFVEYLCGLVIRLGVGMRAWDYRGHFLNIQGLVSPYMALIWGILGLGFSLYFYTPMKRLLAYMNSSTWDTICVGLAIFMIINLTLTAACIIRWANRRRGKPPENRLTVWIDRQYPDSKMRTKFYYWYFLDEPEHIAGSSRRRYKESFAEEREAV